MYPTYFLTFPLRSVFHELHACHLMSHTIQQPTLNSRQEKQGFHEGLCQGCDNDRILNICCLVYLPVNIDGVNQQLDIHIGPLWGNFAGWQLQSSDLLGFDGKLFTHHSRLDACVVELHHLLSFARIQPTPLTKQSKETWISKKKVCAQILPRLRKDFFGHAGALARNICEKLVTLCVCQFHIGKATQEFIELFLQFRALRTTVFNNYRNVMQNMQQAIIGETIPIECGELRNSNLCPMSDPKAKSLDWCYHRLNATWRNGTRCNSWELWKSLLFCSH